MTGRNLAHKTESTGNRRGGMRSHAARQRGFTMIELLVAVAIMMILAAFAIPRVMNAVYLSRIRSAAGNLSALMQQGRVLAEQNNATVPVYTGNGTVGPHNLNGAFVSCISGSRATCPGGIAWVANDPYTPYSANISNVTAASAPALVPQASLGFTTQPAGTILYFTPLGMASNAPAGTFTGQGFVFYLKDNRNNWAAVSVSPTGRSKMWIYTANNWH